MINVIANVCVLGAGVMGCNIAAHLANAGLNVLLLDQPSSNGERNANIHKNLSLFSKLKPNIFFEKDLKSKITIGNFSDNLEDIKDCDWVMEVIIERSNTIFYSMKIIIKIACLNI
jgi:3-hydroxyacyl-CoA dehydrogenase